ncbi:MAG: TlpA disulfide reductase family protein [Bacteroidota bacterium]|jgi:peroxiredoxin
MRLFFCCLAASLILMLNGCASTRSVKGESFRLLKAMDRAMEKYPTRRFTQHYAMKFMTHDDTTHSVYEVTLQRLENDAFGYRIRGTNNYGFFVSYDGSTACMGKLADSSVTLYHEKDNPKRHTEDTFISSASFPHVDGIKRFFMLFDPTDPPTFTLSDEHWQGEAVKVIEIRRVIDEDTPLHIRRITFRLSDTIPIRITEEMHIADPMGTLLQYRDTWVENLELNPILPPEYFSASTLPDFVRVMDYVEPSKEERLPLQAGTPAPDFSAAVYEGDSLRLSELRGKIVFIDFWYTSCHPCQLAVPAIEKMYEEFGRDGNVVFLGVNPYDKADNRFLKKFLASRGVNYPVLLAEYSVAEKYEVPGYPTFFIIDREGVIRWSAVGYAEGYEARFREALTEVLAK